MMPIFQKLKPFGNLLLVGMLSLFSFAYAMFQGGFVSWFLFFSFLPFALYALFLLIYPLKDFKAERMIAEEVRTGEPLKIQIYIERAFPFPLWFVLVEDMLPKRLFSQQRKQMIFVGFKRSVTLTYQIEAVNRGEHLFTHIRLKTADVLGIAQKEIHIPCKDRLIGYPKIKNVDGVLLESRYEQGGLVSSRQFQKDMSVVSGIRKYQPGDRQASIDWKATARVNEMMAKDFEIRQSNDIMIILDRSPSSSFELLVSFTASLGTAILKKGGQAGLYSSGKDETLIPVRGGEEQLHRFMYHLALVQSNSAVEFAHLIKKEKVIYQHPVSFIIVTSKLTGELIDGLPQYNRRKGAVHIFIMEPLHKQKERVDQAIVQVARLRGIMVTILNGKDYGTLLPEVEQA